MRGRLRAPRRLYLEGLRLSRRPAGSLGSSRAFKATAATALKARITLQIQGGPPSPPRYAASPCSSSGGRTGKTLLPAPHGFAALPAGCSSPGRAAEPGATWKRGTGMPRGISTPPSPPPGGRRVATGESRTTGIHHLALPSPAGSPRLLFILLSNQLSCRSRIKRGREGGGGGGGLE